MVVTYYIKIFRNGVDRHSDILMSLLLLVTETITSVKTVWALEEAYLEPCQTSKMEHFCKNGSCLLAFYYFCKTLYFRFLTGFWIGSEQSLYKKSFLGKTIKFFKKLNFVEDISFPTSLHLQLRAFSTIKYLHSRKRFIFCQCGLHLDSFYLRW